MANWHISRAKELIHDLGALGQTSFEEMSWYNRREIARMISTLEKVKEYNSKLLDTNLYPDKVLGIDVIENDGITTKRRMKIHETLKTTEESNVIFNFFKGLALFFTGTPSAAELYDRVQHFKDPTNYGL